MPSLLKKKKAEKLLVEPHPIAIRKLTDQEVKRYAINEALKAVKQCRPGITLGEIMQLEIEANLGKKQSKKAREILRVFRETANEFSKRHGREPLF